MAVSEKAERLFFNAVRMNLFRGTNLTENLFSHLIYNKLRR